MILALNIIFWMILAVCAITLIATTALETTKEKIIFTIAVIAIPCLIPFNIYIDRLEQKELDQKHSIENCDKSNKCFKRIKYETCFKSKAGYDCRMVEESEQIVGTELEK